jgi:hypothetical protein
MNTTATAREARTRNLARLRTLTIGTAVLGVAATTGFGYLAAVTYGGAAATTATTAATTATTNGTSFFGTATTVTTTTRKGHVSSGGS